MEGRHSIDAASDVGATDSGSLFPSQLRPDFHCDPTLSSIRETIFLTSCAWDSCHGANNAVYGMSLVADVDTIFKELVGVPAGGCPPWLRVAAGDPEHSHLWSKVSQAHPACGARMPFGTVPLPPRALACIEGWIRSL